PRLFELPRASAPPLAPIGRLLGGGAGRCDQHARSCRKSRASFSSSPADQYLVSAAELEVDATEEDGSALPFIAVIRHRPALDPQRATDAKEYPLRYGEAADDIQGNILA